MNDFLKRTLELKDEMIAVRRELHRHPELGFDLEFTKPFVKKKLEDMGYSVKESGKAGLTCMSGDPAKGKVILVRADMDALPLNEESGLPFASENPGQGHCCGHDMHTTMLLAAAKVLKEREDELCGAVKFMFQPAEETGAGARDMIASGILADPKPDAVMAMHVNAKSPAFRLNYGKGCTFASNNSIDIHIKGKGCHGARPHEGIDPLKVAVHTYIALQSYISSEVNPMETVIMSITSIEGGGGYNSIPGEAHMKGTLRAYKEELRLKAIDRIKDICESCGKLFGAEVTVEFSEGLKPVFCSPSFTDEILGYAAEVIGRENISDEPEVKMGSEDFAEVTNEYPDTSAYLFIGAGPDKDTAYEVGQHNSKVVFNEDILPYGAAVSANCAFEYLKNNK